MLARFQNLTLDDEERDFLAGMEKRGWMVMTIKDEPGRPSWSYTVGLFENYAHPEVVIFGLKPDSRHSILNWDWRERQKENLFTPGVYADQPLLYEDQLLAARMLHWAEDAKLATGEWPFDCDPHTQTFLSRCVRKRQGDRPRSPRFRRLLAVHRPC